MPIRALLPTPMGAFTLEADAAGLCGVLFPTEAPPAMADMPEPSLVSLDAHPVLAEAGRQLLEYLDGSRRHFDLPLSLHGTAFQQQVWQELGHIPYGETRSYGELAARLGDRRKARPVGGAAHRNPVAIIVPCHRLIGADGSLTGFGGGLPMKHALLELERRNRATKEKN